MRERDRPWMSFVWAIRLTCRWELGIPDVLRWADRQQRILISRDSKTLPGHLTEHLRGGGHSPGLFLLRRVPLPLVVDFLMLAAYASEPSEWENRVEFIP